MAQADTSMAIADSITEQYAGVMDDLIADCTRLEDKNADLQRQLAVALQSTLHSAVTDCTRLCRITTGFISLTRVCYCFAAAYTGRARGQGLL